MLDIRKIVMTSAAGIMLALGVAACENQHPENVPGSAQKMSSSNKELTFIAPERGMAYIYDRQANHLVWSGEVSRGREIKVDPMKNEVSVNGNVVSKGIIQPYHDEEVWFQPSKSTGLVSHDEDQPRTAGSSEETRTTTSAPPPGVTEQQTTTTTYRKSNSND